MVNHAERIRVVATGDLLDLPQLIHGHAVQNINRLDAIDRRQIEVSFQGQIQRRGPADDRIERHSGMISARGIEGGVRLRSRLRDHGQSFLRVAKDILSNGGSKLTQLILAGDLPRLKTTFG